MQLALESSAAANQHTNFVEQSGIDSGEEDIIDSTLIAAHKALRKKNIHLYEQMKKDEGFELKTSL